MVKFVAVALLLGVIIVYVRAVNSEFTSIALLGASVILISFSFNYVTEIYEFINKLIQLSYIDSNYIKIIFKITAIGYLVEFGAGLLEDFNLKSLGDKLVLLGKLIILATALPIIQGVLNIIINFIK